MIDMKGSFAIFSFGCLIANCVTVLLQQISFFNRLSELEMREKVVDRFKRLMEGKMIILYAILSFLLSHKN